MATKVFDLYAEISLNNSSYMEGLKTSESAGKDFESSLKDNTSKTKTGFDTLSTAVSACKTVLATVGIGFTMDKVIKGLSEAYNEATKLDEKLRGASTLYGSVAVDQTKLVDNLKSISLQTGESLEVLGQTVYDAMSAGVQPTEDMAEVLQVVSASSKLAKAGFTDTNTAMKASLSVINAYGMGIENINKVSDILLNTQNLGVTTVGELSNALSKVTPVASAFGVSIENVTSALALMTKQGTNTEVASTGLSSILSELGKSGTTASENLQKASLSAGLTETSFKGLLDSGKSLGDILDIMSTYAEQNNLSLVDMFSSIEAGKSALQITNAGAEEFNETLDSMETATGLVSESFEKMVTPSQRLDSAIATLKTTIGEKLKPAIDSAKTSVANLITKMLGQEGQAEDLDTAMSTLNKTLEDYALAQEEAKKKTDAHTLAMETLAKSNARSALRALSESWKQYEKQSEGVISSTEMVKSKIKELYERASEYATKDLKLIGEEDLEDISDYDERLTTLLVTLKKYADNRPTYKDGSIDIQAEKIYNIIDSIDAYTIKLSELELSQSNLQESFKSTAEVVAQYVQEGKLSLAEVQVYAGNLYDDVVEILQNTKEEYSDIGEVVEETNGDIEDSVSTTVDTLLQKLSLMEKKIEEYFPNAFDSIKKSFNAFKFFSLEDIEEVYDLLKNPPATRELKPFDIDLSPIALAKTEFSKASDSIMEDTELTKIEIYNALKDLSKEYELTATDMVIISRAIAEANSEILESFIGGIKSDMKGAFHSITASFETLGEALVESEGAWETFGSIAYKALIQILEALGNQLTIVAVSKAVMGDWAGASFAGAGAILAYTTAGVANAEAKKMLEKIGVDTSEIEKSEEKEEEEKKEPEAPKTEQEIKEERIASLEDEIAMLEALVDNKEQGVEIPEQYQQDAKIRELQDRVRELEGRLNDTKEVTVVQNINTVPMTPYELEQQAYIMAERLQWS